jgi:hypothetical protein
MKFFDTQNNKKHYFFYKLKKNLIILFHGTISITFYFILNKNHK